MWNKKKKNMTMSENLNKQQMTINIAAIYSQIFKLLFAITLHPKYQPDSKNTQYRCNNTPHVCSFLAIIKWESRPTITVGR